MMSKEQLQKLADAASTAPEATRLERDAGHFVRVQLKLGLAVPTDVADILTRYQGRQIEQNRWGK